MYLSIEEINSNPIYKPLPEFISKNVSEYIDEQKTNNKSFYLKYYKVQKELHHLVIYETMNNQKFIKSKNYISKKPYYKSYLKKSKKRLN